MRGWQMDDETGLQPVLVGFDLKEPTAHQRGKVDAIAKLRQTFPYETIIMIGDGITGPPPSPHTCMIGVGISHLRYRSVPLLFVMYHTGCNTRCRTSGTHVPSLPPHFITGISYVEITIRFFLDLNNLSDSEMALTQIWRQHQETARAPTFSWALGALWRGKPWQRALTGSSAASMSCEACWPSTALPSSAQVHHWQMLRPGPRPSISCEIK